MKKLCVLVGLAAIGYKLQVASMFALWLGSGATEIINVLFGAAIAAWFGLGDRLGERSTGAAWAVYGFGVAGALVFLFKFFPLGLYAFWILAKLGVMGLTVLTSARDALLLLCFLKLAADLISKDELAATGEKT